MARQLKRDPKKRFGHPFIMGYHMEDRKPVPDFGPSVPRVAHHMTPEVVDLELTAADVMAAHRKKGEGDSRFCAVAMLIRRQAEKFSPLAVNGVVEFTDSRAMVGIGRPGSYPGEVPALLPQLFVADADVRPQGLQEAPADD